MPKVSVLVPVFNGEAEIARALDAIFAQTFRDYEVLVLDDGSADRSLEVVARYPQARLIRQANRGIGASRQRLLEMAAGEWVAFCDHDDEWHPAKLAVQLAAVQASAVLVHADFGQIWAPPPGAVALDHLLPDNRIHTSSALFRREAALAAGGFPLDSSRAEDYAAWFRLASCGEFVWVPEALTTKHVRAGSASAPTAAWYAAERSVLKGEFLDVLDRRFPSLESKAKANFRRLALRKIAIAYSLEGECLDREGNRGDAWRCHWEGVRGNPSSPGAWGRMLRHLFRWA
ncbi:MAG: glycosyltransferase family 2 protein [Fimbriimonas sp.]